MWPFRKPAVITIGEFEASLRKHGVRDGFARIADMAERQRQFDKYEQVRDRFYNRHLRSLTPEEQQAFADETHPSQSHASAKNARPMCARLEAHLSGIGVTAFVMTGNYHVDRVVLNAELTGDPAERRGELPWLFHGYVVKYAVVGESEYAEETP